MNNYAGYHVPGWGLDPTGGKSANPKLIYMLINKRATGGQAKGYSGTTLADIRITCYPQSDVRNCRNSGNGCYRLWAQVEITVTITIYVDMNPGLSTPSGQSTYKNEMEHAEDAKRVGEIGQRDMTYRRNVVGCRSKSVIEKACGILSRHGRDWLDGYWQALGARRDIKHGSSSKGNPNEYLQQALMAKEAMIVEFHELMNR